MRTVSDSAPTSLESPLSTVMGRRNFSIGLPKCNDRNERRFPLTPEAAAMLIEQGFTIKMETGASSTIHYTDNQYRQSGVDICTRNEAFGCDMVVHLAPLAVPDIRRMRRGALLFTLFSLCRQQASAVRELLSSGIIAIAIDLIEDTRGNFPFSDILAEIDGRSAIASASALLADAVHGKGILLGGIAGVVPCEVTIIGSGIAACAAAKSAIGTGATVRMFDHDLYRLRDAMRELGCCVVGSSIHPKVFYGALRTADVVVYAGVSPALAINSDIAATMKRGVVVYDLTDDCGRAFPSLPIVDLAAISPVDFSPTEPTRVCYVNAGSSVPRTAAMALSNSFITLLRDIVTCEGVTNALKLLPGLQRAVYTFLGKPVNPRIAAIAGMRHVDINIYLTLS